MNENKDIYLIDLGDEISWCDCPDPANDIEPEDVTHYVRVDVFNSVKQETQKLREALLDAIDNLELRCDTTTKGLSRDLKKYYAIAQNKE